MPLEPPREVTLIEKPGTHCDNAEGIVGMCDAIRGPLETQQTRIAGDRTAEELSEHARQINGVNVRQY